MWILEHEGGLFGGKRKWLKPGSRLLIGRASSKGDGESSSDIGIPHKSVSKKHLVIEVAEPEASRGASFTTRSVVTIEDLDSKFSTILNGEKYKNVSRVAAKDENILQLGNWAEPFRIKWHPVVLSFTFTTKDYTRDEDPLKAVQSRLARIDVQATTEYIVGKTTHVVANKRNTPKGLQALVDAKHIVTEDYLGALERATSLQANAENPDAPDAAPLQEDFDGRWPDELEYLPEAGKEPIPRPAHFFRPKAERGEVFKGYTFVFADSQQHEQLSPAIQTGNGKTLLCPVKLGETLASEFVRFVKDTAGEKDDGELADGQRNGKGVVVVRMGRTKGHGEWAADFTKSSDLALGQRSIEQNEFLDAILVVEAKPLKRPLEEGIEVESSVPLPMSSAPARTGTVTHSSKPAATHTTPPPTSEAVQGHGDTTMGDAQEVAPQDAEQTSPQPKGETKPKRKPLRRPITKSRFKGFDDFDPSQVVKVDEDEPMTTSNDAQPATEPDAAEESQMPVRNARKRPLDDVQEVNESQEVDDLLPAAAAMKKRRMDAAARAETSAANGHESESTPEKVKAKARAKREEKPMPDVAEFARKRREAEEEAARLDKEALEKGLEGLDVDDVRRHIQVEELEIPERTDRPSRLRDGTRKDRGDDERWDPKWNGRKNFKKFRRQDEGDAPRRGQRIIVRLEEVSRKETGWGEGYWGTMREKDSQSQQSSKGKGRQAEVQQEEEEEQGHSFRRSNRGSRTVPEEEIVEVDDAEESIPASPPSNQTPARSSRRRQPHDENPPDSSTQTVTASPEVQRGKGKRPAAGEASGKNPPAEKSRVSAIDRSGVGDDDDDDEDEGTKFHFRRRR